jgi:transcriptional regulator with XRE-family HTH domain
MRNSARGYPAKLLFDRNVRAVGALFQSLAVNDHDAAPSAQEDLAGLLGLSQATIHHYEKGNDRISASRLLSIAHALESSITGVGQPSDVATRPSACARSRLLRRCSRIKVARRDAAAPTRPGTALLVGDAGKKAGMRGLQ